MKKVAICQSNYIPWIGYFELISSVSDFVFLDNVQYTRRDWRNRNQIKTPQGKLWLTINVKVDNDSELIQEVQFVDTDWKSEHLEAIRRNYRRSKFFDSIFPEIEQMYQSFDGFSLSQFNQHLICNISARLGIETRFHDATNFVTSNNNSQRLLDICMNLQASTYVSGPSAKDYLDVSIFRDKNVIIEWFEYSRKEFDQLWGNFQRNVSVFDPILNNGWNVLNAIRENV